MVNLYISFQIMKKTLSFEETVLKLQVGQKFYESHKIQVENGQKVLVKLEFVLCLEFSGLS